ncbi:MAG: hypothetical protein O9296_01810 [Novosphingobium sp.]|nr:hypothetical protein [Novosphingobium sp.]
MTEPYIVVREWSKDAALRLIAAPGGACFGFVRKDPNALPILASFTRPTAADGKMTEEWGRVVPGTGLQIGVWRWESGLRWAVYRHVQWPHVAGREPWSPPLPKRAATFFGIRLREWFMDLRRVKVIRRGEPRF